MDFLEAVLAALVHDPGNGFEWGIFISVDEDTGLFAHAGGSPEELCELLGRGFGVVVVELPLLVHGEDDLVGKLVGSGSLDFR